MKKALSVLMTSALTVGMLAACGPEEGATSTTPGSGSGGEKPEKLVVWEDKDKGPALDYAIKSFEKEHGIKIEYKEVETTKIQEQLALDGPAGTAPDVVTIPHDNIGPAVTKGLLAELTTTSDETTSRFSESSIDAMTFDGKLYGLPKATETPVLVYNKALMKEAPKTMDELKDFSADFTKDGKYGFLALLDNYYFAHGFLSGYGGYVFGEEDGSFDTKDLGINNAQAVEAVDYINTWYKDKLLSNGIIGENGGSALDGLFNEGKVASVMNGPWSFQGYKAAGIDIGAAPMPKLPNGEPVKTFMGVKGWNVTSFSTNKEWAEKFIDHITNDENAKKRYELTQEIPPNTALLEDPIIKDNELASAVAMQSQDAVPMPSIPEMSEVWPPMQSAVQTVITGKADSKKALDEARKTIEENIKANHSGK